MADHLHLTLAAKTFREPGTDKFHLVVGKTTFQGHRLRGADCRCEPKIERIKDHPNARVFCHHTRNIKCL